MFKEFKEFAVKGNIIDLAVGVIIGGAFGKIVASLVNDVIMPIVGILLGGVNFSTLEIKFADAVIRYGAFLQTMVDFLIIAFAIFMFVRVINRLKRRLEKEQSVVVVVPQAPPAPTAEQVLLTEIRDLLKK